MINYLVRPELLLASEPLRGHLLDFGRLLLVDAVRLLRFPEIADKICYVVSYLILLLMQG